MNVTDLNGMLSGGDNHRRHFYTKCVAGKNRKLGE